MRFVMKSVDVLIVGMGPTGMVLANELQKWGINYFIIDKREAVSSMTRAVNITPASLALLQYSLKLNLADEIIQTEKIHLFWENKWVSDVNYEKMNFPYKSFSYYKQPHLEKALKDKLDKSRIKEKTELKTIEKNPAGGYKVLLDNEEICSQYIIGCDGNNSLVRNWITQENDFEDYGAHFLLFDIETNVNFTEEGLYYIYSDGYIIIAPIDKEKNQYRIVLSSAELSKTATEQYNDINFIENYFSKKSNTVISVEKIIWFTSGTFRHRISSVAQHENIFLCGDAYHIFSPVGGLNLNTGLQDAINLAWKLAYVIQGKASPSFLKTYAVERGKSVERTRNATKEMTHYMTNFTTKGELKNHHTNTKNIFEYILPKILSGYDNQYQHVSELFLKEEYDSFCNSINNLGFNLVLNNNQWLLISPDGYIVDAIEKEKLNEVENSINKKLFGE